MIRHNRPWSRDEFILVLNLYYKLPFGKLSRATPEVKELARLLGRSSNSIALRLVNFASCDPYILSTGRHGMSASRKQCQPYWDEFVNDRETLLYESEVILSKLQGTTIEQKYSPYLTDISKYTGEDKIRETVCRVNQSIFRDKILSNYNFKCAISGIDIQPLLVASHIIPWAINKEERLNPANGICLSSLYDAAFDKGLIGFDKDYKVILSKELQKNCTKEYYQKYFGLINGTHLNIPPNAYMPDIHFLEWHMDEIFIH